MLNKRIKSLLVAGIVMLGMTGGVFAEEPLTSTITNPKFNEKTSRNRYKFQQKSIIVNTHDQGSYMYDVDVKWNANLFKIKQVIIYGINGVEVQQNSISRFEEALEGNEGWKNADLPVVDLNEQIVRIEIVYELVDADGNGVPDVKDDKVPEEEIVDPEAGDANTVMMFGGAAIGAGALLVLVNRKK